MPATAPKTVVFGAAGLIGSAIAGDLTRRGLPVAAVARRFTAAQRNQFGTAAREIPIARLDIAALTKLLQECKADVIVNCLGVLQDTASDSTQGIHEEFVSRLLAALRMSARPALLVHLSIPGMEVDDRTSFARSKRKTEHAIAQSGQSYAILRPGFVFASAAYGGSAMLRALAALPLEPPVRLVRRPFAVVAVEDIAETVATLAQRWRPEHEYAVCWDLMHSETRSLGDALASLRGWFGTPTRWHIRMPAFFLTVGAWAGDAAAWLGWRPPIRSTALAELQRGVAGDPRDWIEETGIVPQLFDDVLRARPVTVQEKWFARLYLLKALMIACLAVFWCVSALIALTIAYPAAVAILTAHGYPDGQAQFMTVAGSAMDFSVGVAIACRHTSRWGLLAGVAVSLFYMGAAAILTPELWVEPLGALVKTGPAIVLMLVALAIADDR